MNPELGPDGKYFYRLKKNPKKGICKVYRCSNKCSCKDRVCRKHRLKLEIVRDSLKYSFNYARNNAKRRGIPFYLSFEDFKFFWLTLYPELWEQKKKNLLRFNCRKIKQRSCSYEIDRIDESQGYWINRKSGITGPLETNIAPISKRLNATRSWDYRRRKMLFGVEMQKEKIKL